MSPVDDVRWMSRALGTAARLRCSTRPNPSVGCVVVRDGLVVGEGVTQPPGQAHAEVMALRQAGGRALGATAYVTLEPCAHHGRTPPCTEALIDAGVARVVFGVSDPNLAAAGGQADLVAAGVSVTSGCLAAWSARLNDEFLHRVARPDRPWVVLKLAQTIEGRLVADEGRWITGPRARHVVHGRRARADAVLVGSGTVLADDPGLDVRLGPPVDEQPRPVVLDGRGRTPATARVVRPGAVVLTSTASSMAWRRELIERGAHVQVVRRRNGRLDLADVMASLRSVGILHVFAEPGRVLASSMIAEDVVDVYVQHVAVDGADASMIRPVAGLDDTGRWVTSAWRWLGPDLEVVRRPPHRRVIGTA